jgi:hypothetical protein
VCRFHVAAGEKLHADKQFIWRPCLECHEASKHHLLKFGFLLLVRYTLVSQLREDLLMCSSYLPLGVPNELYLQAINEFFGAVAREKEDFCKGSLARTIFYFIFVLLYFIFTCIILSKIQKISFFYSCFYLLALILLEWVLLKTPSCVILLAPKTMILSALLLRHLLLRQIFMRSNLLC